MRRRTEPYSHNLIDLIALDLVREAANAKRRAPLRKEIARVLGIASTDEASRVLKRLVESGLIQKPRQGRSMRPRPRRHNPLIALRHNNRRVMLENKGRSKRRRLSVVVDDSLTTVPYPAGHEYIAT